MPINVPAITWTEQADPTSPIASYAYSLSAADDISFGLNAERFGIVTRPRFVSVDNTRNTGSVTVRMYNAFYTILGSQAQTVPIQTKTDRLQIIGANGTLGVTFFLNEPYAAGVNYSDLLAEQVSSSSATYTTTLYLGTGAARQVTTGIDALTDDVLAILKSRNKIATCDIYDTVRGGSVKLQGNSSLNQVVNVNGLISFGASNISLGSSNDENQININYVCHEIKKSSGFDIVTWIGDGTGPRSIPHGLGSKPGAYVVKRFSGSTLFPDFYVWHEDLSANQYLRMNSDAAALTSATVIPSDPTSTDLIVGADINQSGSEFIAYVFGNDPSAASKARCGFYTGNGSAAGPVVTLPKKPDLLIVKRVPGLGSWPVIDSTRGGGAYWLFNDTSQETVTPDVSLTSTGFQITTASGTFNNLGDRYIYIAVFA